MKLFLGQSIISAGSSDTLSGEVDTLESNLTTLSGEVDTLESSLTTLSGEVDSLKTNEPLSNFVLMGA